MDYVDMFLIHWPMAMQVWNPDIHEHKRLSDTIYTKINLINICYGWKLLSPLLQPTDEIFPKDENGKIIYEDDKTDITETWKVHVPS